VASTLSIEVPNSVARPLDTARMGDHLDRLCRVARALTGSAHAAEDLVQDTLVGVLGRPRMVRAEDDFGYLVTALRYRFIDNRRRRRVELTSLEDLPVEPVAQSSQGQPEAEVMAREVYRAIASLPDVYRDVLAAIDLGGLSYAEAADVLDVPPGTVMSRLYRARAQLAAQFAASSD
jgi:RNA polymerase sigma-70 factor, ECF subfamily